MTTTNTDPVPAALASLLDTIKSPSAVQPSAIIKSPVKFSNPATVVSASGASLAVQPSTVLSVIVPVTAGAVVSASQVNVI